MLGLCLVTTVALAPRAPNKYLLINGRLIIYFLKKILKDLNLATTREAQHY